MPEKPATESPDPGKPIGYRPRRVACAARLQAGLRKSFEARSSTDGSRTHDRARQAASPLGSLIATTPTTVMPAAARNPHRSTNRFVVAITALTMAAHAFSSQAAPPPPNPNQCKSKWVLTPAQQLDFGSFSIDSGSGTITMNSSAALTTSGQINLSTSNPVTTFSATVDNSLGAVCASYGFTLDWNTQPAPLAGPGTDIPLNNVRVSIPAYSLNNVSLPQTIAANPANALPFSLSLYGTISVSSPQSAGLYTSPAFIVDLVQSGTANPLNGTASATVFTPLSILETVTMDFGTVAGGSIAGTVVLNTSSGRTPTGGAQVLVSGPGNAATFQVTGEPGQVYSLSIGDGTLANAGGQLLTVTSFTNTSTGNIPGSGIDIFQVGATLSLGANQPAGSYSTANGGGTPYTITVNYN